MKWSDERISNWNMYKVLPRYDRDQLVNWLVKKEKQIVVPWSFLNHHKSICNHNRNALERNKYMWINIWFYSTETQKVDWSCAISEIRRNILFNRRKAVSPLPSSDIDSRPQAFQLTALSDKM